MNVTELMKWKKSRKSKSWSLILSAVEGLVESGDCIGGGSIRGQNTFTQTVRGILNARDSEKLMILLADPVRSPMAMIFDLAHVGTQEEERGSATRSRPMSRHIG